MCARWPGKPPCYLFSIEIGTKILVHQLYYKEKSNAPEPDTKTPKNQAVEKIGERVPSTKAMVRPLEFSGTLFTI